MLAILACVGRDLLKISPVYDLFDVACFCHVSFSFII